MHSVNTLYLIIHSATGYFKEKTVKNTQLLLPQRNMKKSFLELNKKLKQLMMEKEY